MNKVIKWICIGCGITAALGIVMIICGRALGGSLVWNLSSNGVHATGVGAEEIVTDAQDLEAFTIIDADSAHVDLYIEEGDSYKYEYQTYTSNEPIISVANNTLKIEVPKNNSISFSINGFTSYEEYIKITVPAGDEIYDLDVRSSSGCSQIKDVNIKGKLQLSSGELSIENSATDDNLYLELTSGDLNVIGVKAADLKVKMSSGQISFNDVEANTMDVEETSGDSSFTNVTVNDWTDRCTSGSLTCNNLTAKNYAHKASTGWLDLDSCTIDSFDCEITSGDVSITNIVTDKVNFRASSGCFDMSIDGSQNDYGYNLSTTTGSISYGNLDFEGSIKADESKDKQIKTSVTSGDVTITFSK